MLEEIGENVH